MTASSNPALYAQAMVSAIRHNLKWHNKNLMRVLEQAKEKQARDIDKSIYLGNQLQEVLNKNVAVAKPVAARIFAPPDRHDLMKPVDPEVTAVLMQSISKGGTERYLKIRNELSPEDKYNFRAQTSWDYGWSQRGGMKRDAHRPRLKLLKETFYRVNNVAPDPPFYRLPASTNVAFCSDASCPGP